MVGIVLDNSISILFIRSFWVLSDARLNLDGLSAEAFITIYARKTKGMVLKISGHVEVVVVADSRRE